MQTNASEKNKLLSFFDALRSFDALKSFLQNTKQGCIHSPSQLGGKYRYTHSFKAQTKCKFDTMKISYASPLASFDPGQKQYLFICDLCRQGQANLYELTMHTIFRKFVRKFDLAIGLARGVPISTREPVGGGLLAPPHH